MQAGSQYRINIQLIIHSRSSSSTSINRIHKFSFLHSNLLKLKCETKLTKLILNYHDKA